MADSRVLIEIVSTAKGLKVVAKDTEKLAKNVDKVDKGQKKAEKSGNKYHKQQKAIHQSNLSSAKGFSKMNETMGSGGSSGLVGAYATLAANVFAATAAFNALRGAAQVETLVEGFTFLADTAGRSADIVAASVQRITDNALSMEDAFRASSIAITSGFSTTQLERLVSVGKNASIALGRNLGDSVDRLIRGVAKLEPEILDELGIMVRLDTATTKYAATLGKTAADLTDFEKRQAFLNAAIEQGETKYSALAGSVEVNSFDKLAGTFANLTHSVMSFVNTAVKPLVAIFANSQVAMFGAIAFLAKGVISTMFPVLTDLGARFASTADKAHKAADKIKSSSEKAFDESQTKVGGMKTEKGDPAGFVALQKSAKKGTTSTGELNKAMNGLNKSIALREKGIKDTDAVDYKAKKAQYDRIVKMRDATQDLIDKEKQRGKATGAQARSAGSARGADIISEGAGAISGSTGIGGIKQAFSSFKEYNVELKETKKNIGDSFGDKGQSRMSKFGTASMNGFKRAGAGVKLFGAAAINAIPLVGQIIFVVGLLITAFKKLTSFSGATGTALNDLQAIGDGVSGKMETLSKVQNKLTARSEKLTREQDFLKEKLLEVADAQEKAGMEARIAQIEFEKQRLVTLKLNAALRVNAGILTELAGASATLGNALEESTPTGFQAWWTRTKKSIKEGEEAGTGFGGVWGQLKNAFAQDPIVKFFSPIKDEAAATQAKLNLFEEGINKSLLAMGDKGPVKEITAAFGKNGLSGRIAELVKEGRSFDYIQKDINKTIQEVTDSANKELASIDALAPGFEELSKKVIAFSDRAAKKNAFITLGKDVEVFNKKIVDLVTNQGGSIEEAQKQLETVVSPEMISQLEAMGVNYKNILGEVIEVKDEQGNITYEVKGSLVTLQDRLNAHGLEKEVLKEQLATEKAKTEESIKQNKFDRLKLEMAAKQLNLEKKGVYELGPAAEQANASALFDTAVKNSKLKRDQTEDHAKRNRDHILEGAALEFGLDSERYEVEKKHQQELFEQKVRDAVALKLLTDAQAKDALNQARGTAGTSGSTVERARSIQERNKGLKEGETVGFQQTIVDMQNQAQPMLDTLKSLGPDGEFAAAAISGTLSIASSIATIGEEGLKSAEGLEAMGSVVGTIGGIMAAASKAQIAEVDKQIQAEKNRDGKSKESLAKIKAMEAKKEQMKRKAFEQNKKMQIAETIINTAAAIMAQKGNLPMMLLMGVLGAAQLAVIQKTQYQGGGGSVEAPKTQTIGIGKRDNKVDVSRSATAGELSYLRGARGIGSNANSFTPGGAAGMRRSYASGGEILVGEQGPEVIQPTSSGYNVVPNDKIGGSNLNANITINAVDAAGVEDVLTAQTGTIINMLQQAAHEHGEEFIEAVNPAVYKLEK